MNYYKESVLILKDLNKDYPSYPLGRHISLAFDEDCLDSISDRDFFLLLQKYQHELDLGGPIEDDFTSKIIEDGEHLFDNKSYDNE